ncbi:YdcF family protein [Novosphingobium sp. FSY-8]|uniref:YdcF family protein n=1 Tax=Novosphingobium ovatum TaxID=1908523 RepID=A0ABW9XDS8_9SPHN|nr:YdcF family protein [Novosphingobium ovatum]NBC36680.1 YdcF family protein [Novosphingobium ovatum]
MLRRALALILLAWVLGFVLFAVTLPRPADERRTQAVVVLTGGEGRINRGVEALQRHWARRMLISGVDPEVKPGELAAQYEGAGAWMGCCITLGYDSVDTRSNAREVADWVRDNRVTSIRLVTSDWHMRRAAWELRQTLPDSVTVIEDAVPTHPSFGVLMGEYAKLLVRRVLRLGGK